MKDSILKLGRDTLHVMLHQEHTASAAEINYPAWIFLITGLVALAVIFRKQLFRTVTFSEYELNFSIFKIAGKIQYSTAGQEAAWKIYVELKTSVSSNMLAENTGILREALQSLFLVFGVLRETLKNAGAELAREAVDSGKLTVASLLLLVMNDHLRPFLSRWHPLLQEHEANNPGKRSQYAHEKAWEYNSQCRKELTELKDGLDEYVSALLHIAGGK